GREATRRNRRGASFVGVSGHKDVGDQSAGCSDRLATGAKGGAGAAVRRGVGGAVPVAACELTGGHLSGGQSSSLIWASGSDLCRGRRSFFSTEAVTDTGRGGRGGSLVSSRSGIGSGGTRL